MVKNRILNPIFFAIILMALALSSCKDWLSIAPENDLIKEKFWTKTEDVTGALAATYDAFRDGAVKSLLLGEVRADLVVIGSNVYGGDYKRIASSDINASNGAVTWTDYYRTINLANTLMFYDKVVFEKDKSFTQKMKDGVDAEALFLRSLSYFYLVRVWKDVPLVLEPSISDTSALFLPTSSEKKVVAQIIKDLLVAKDLAYTDEFRNDPLHPAYFNGRANKYSIMALLADIYLWDQQYQNCMNYCDSVTIQGQYSLEPFATWFDLYNPGNSKSESIFEIQYNDNLDSQENPFFNDVLAVSGGIGFGKIVTSLFSRDDLRNYMGLGGIFKYVGLSFSNPVLRNGSQRDAHFIYYRYADILLMKAEAATELGQFGVANENLRPTAERAGLTPVEITVKEDLRKAILDERGREFEVEGKRWFDLLRAAKRNHFEKKQIIIDMILAGAANIQIQAVLRTKVFDTMSYYLPIPEHELLFNPKLEQNPFYNR